MKCAALLIVGVLSPTPSKSFKPLKAVPTFGRVSPTLDDFDSNAASFV